MFPLCRQNKIKHDVVVLDNAPKVIEGWDVYDVLCPVSTLTGHRINPLALLDSLLNDPVKSRQLDAFLAELPTIDSVDLSDDDRVSLMMDRLSTGTPAENAVYRKHLEIVAKDYFESISKVSDVDGSSKQTIDFQSSDTPSE